MVRCAPAGRPGRPPLPTIALDGASPAHTVTGDFRRRRPRRGSLARPINGRLYRASFLVVLLAAASLLAFAVTRPVPLAKPSLPGSFDTASALALANDLSIAVSRPPTRERGRDRRVELVRRPVAAPVVRARDAYVLLVRAHPGTRDACSYGTSSRSRRGQSQDVIVVMAHRDDIGTGPGANDNASGTAALIELARAYAQPLRRGGDTRRLAAPDRVPLDRRRRLRRARRRPLPRVLAVSQTGSSRWSTSTRSREQGGRASRSRATRRALPTRASWRPRSLGSPSRPAQHLVTSSVLGQLVDLAFPFTLYEQGPFVAAGIPAITITTGRRPPAARVRRPQRDTGLDAARTARRGGPAAARVARPGPRARPEPGELRLGRRAGRARLGDRARPDRPARPVRRRDRRPLRALPAPAGALRPALRVAAHPAPVLVLRRDRFHVFSPPRRLAVRSRRDHRTRNGDRRRLAGVRARRPRCGHPGSAGRSSRQRLATRRPVTAEEELAGYTVALVALLVVALVIAATNAFALLFAAAGAPRLALAAAAPDRPAARAARAVRCSASSARPSLVVSLAMALRPRLRHAVVPARARRDRLRQADRHRDRARRHGSRGAAGRGCRRPLRALPGPGASAGRAGPSASSSRVRRSVAAPSRRRGAAPTGRGSVTAVPAASSPVAPGNEHERVGRRGARDHVRLLAR